MTSMDVFLKVPEMPVLILSDSLEVDFPPKMDSVVLAIFPDLKI